METNKKTAKELHERTFEFVKDLIEEKFEIQSIVKCLTTHAAKLGTQTCYYSELPIRDMLWVIAGTLDTIARSKYDDENDEHEEELEENKLQDKLEKTLH